MVEFEVSNLKCETKHQLEIKDWYISEDDVANSLIYPGPYVISQVKGPHSTNLLNDAHELLALAKKACYLTDESTGNLIEILDDYRVEYKDRFLRGHRQRSVDGIIHVLRVTAKEVPKSSCLGLPEQILHILMGKKLGDTGGLIIVCGQPGHGKSTTCASIIMDRVTTYGSFCLTVEDPPEFPLSGNYPTKSGRVGKIIQVPVPNGEFSKSLKDALRCYPSDMMGSMLLVGEVRDSDSAVQVIRAAATGQLVFMTTHAGGPIMAIERLVSLANGQLQDTKEAANLLASCLKGIIHQTLDNEELKVEALFSNAPDSVVANYIRSGNVMSLSSELNSQATKLRLGELETYFVNAGKPKK